VTYIISKSGTPNGVPQQCELLSFFLQRKIGASKAYSDVERVNNLDIFAPQAHTRKRLIARRRRDARVYKGIATASVTFCERGAATEHMKKSHSFE